MTVDNSNHFWTETSVWKLKQHFFVCTILDNEDRRKKITIAIKPVVPNRNDSTDNIMDIRNVVQGLRLSPTLQVSSSVMCDLPVMNKISVETLFVARTWSEIA